MQNLKIGDFSCLLDYERTVPKIDVERTGYGYTYTGIRRVEDQQVDAERRPLFFPRLPPFTSKQLEIEAR